MTRILFDNIVFSLQKAGGVSCVWKELIERVQQKTGFESYFLDYKSGLNNISRNELLIENQFIINSDKIPVFLERYMNPTIDTFKSDYIFHSSYYRTCSSKHAKNITTVHDFVYEKYRTGMPRLVHQLQKKKAVFNSDAVICVSNNTKIDLLTLYPQLEEKKVFVVHNGVSSLFRKIQREKVPESIQKLGNYVLYIGNRTDAHKNFNSLIYALEKREDINLVLIGGGILNDSESTHLNNRIKNRYFHLGHCSNEELNTLYNFAFALVYPSVYEGFGIPVLEAQRAGCPVIATNRSSISEIAGPEALLMEAGDPEEIRASIDLLQNATFRKNLMEAGLKNSNSFSWDKMASEVLNIYDLVLPLT